MMMVIILLIIMMMMAMMIVFTRLRLPMMRAPFLRSAHPQQKLVTSHIFSALDILMERGKVRSKEMAKIVEIETTFSASHIIMERVDVRSK